ncbi:HNH endonuclease [Shinella zoogloeoides]|uniref:HNH endonuclease n=1 Tax=Shinella zoogloeoides TaxID=352475 RepID=UPI00299D0492|nr:HNH endonuclease [Shinella zoogloeoides]WPE22473.1 hypothetical protein ShzoTeo12_36890 [Shinella zoogloeoides]
MKLDYLLPDASALRRLFAYNPETGVLSWRARPLSDFATENAGKVWNSKFADKPAGGLNNYGYVRVAIGGKRFLAHRIIWLMQTGEFPDDVNHENGIHDDNRWSNLRSVSYGERVKNACRRSDNSSGTTGVAWFKALGQWRAYVTIKGRQKHLGYFDTIDEAKSARELARRQHGFHENHGREGAKTMFTDLQAQDQGRLM